MVSVDKNRELEELFRLSLKGDNASYELFLTEIYNIIKPLIRSKLVNQAGSMDTEDVAQEVLISVHRARHTYDINRAFLPWLYTIVNHKIIDLMRKKKIEKKKLEKLSTDEELSLHHEENVNKEKIERVEELMNALSTRDYELLKLSKIDGYSIKEIAHELQLGVSAVKVALHRVYKRLKLKEGVVK